MKRLLLCLFIIFIFLSGCALIEDTNDNNITNFLFPSDGATIDENGNIQLETAIEDNRFSYVALQLWTDVPSLHIMNISTATEGKQTGLYMHKLETGYYNITLKANSNKKDEAVFARVMLINGRSYTYSYNIEKFAEKSALISGFKFKMN